MDLFAPDRIQTSVFLLSTELPMRRVKKGRRFHKDERLFR